MKIRAACALFCLLLIISYGLAAQSETAQNDEQETGETEQSETHGDDASSTEAAETQSLPSVTVTGTGSEKRLSDSPVVTELISEEEIEESGAQTLDEILEDYGILFTSGAGHGDYIQLQGVGKAGVLLLIDGRRVIGRVARRYETSGISLADVERIEIVRGPQSALYGSEAIGGVINIITKDGGDELRYSIHAENLGLPGYDDQSTNESPSLADADLFSEQQLSASVDIPFGTSNLGIDLHGARSGGYFAEDGETTISPAFLMGKGSVSFESSLTDRLDAEVGTSFSSYRQDDQTDFTGSLDRVDIQRLETYVSGNFYPADIMSATIGAYYNYYRRDSSSYVAGTDTWSDGTDFDSQHYVAVDARGNVFIGESQLLTFGFEVNYEQLESPDISTDDNTADRSTQAVFVQDELYREDVYSVITGLRAEHNSQYGLWATPKISAMYYLSPGIRLLGGLGMGYHAPDFNDLYIYMTEDYGVSHPIVEGNEDLEPEYSLAANVGLELVKELWNARVNLYHQELFNEIAAQLTGETYSDGRAVYRYENVARSFRFGTDAEVQLHIAGPLSASVAHGFVLAYDRDEKTQLYDQPAHMLRGKISANFDDIGFSSYVGARYFSPLEPEDDVSAEEEGLAEHRMTLNFYAEQRIADGVQIYLKIDNLTGYVNTSLGPYVPQQFSLGLRIDGSIAKSEEAEAEDGEPSDSN